MLGRFKEHPPGELRNMKPNVFHSLCSSEGKGLIGCMVAIVLLAVAIYLGITLVPIYYTNFDFENDVKTTASRAGSHFFDDEAVIKEILDLAKKNELRVAREDVKVDRFAGQLHIIVHYSVPVDFLIFEHNLNFTIDASSFIGAL
jgi:hypothetical protein